ncbi:MAG: rhomboid family intramembrane serine protease [Azospirillum sp.]|nr:rhomboid family intramembrane serine protease [Azospirillum sp.]
MRASQPAINVPPVTLGLIALTFGAYALLRLLMSDALWLVYDAFGFVPARYSGGAGFGWPAFVAPFSYLFLHGDWMHLAVNLVTLAAFGSGVERRVGGATTLSLFFLCGLVAAGAHYAVYPDSVDPVIGASGAISGLMAGALLVLRERGHMGGQPLVYLAALWILAFTLPDLIGLDSAGGARVAWVAHIGGFVAGLVLFQVFVRRSS